MRASFECAAGARGPIFPNLNIDGQDEQDKPEEGLLRQEVALPIIRSGLAEARDYKTPSS